jgi:hypothetical protein
VMETWGISWALPPFWNRLIVDFPRSPFHTFCVS